MAKRLNKYQMHGLSRTPEYKCWTGIKDRCLNPNSQSFSRYGGRGITICDRWINSFENFLKDVGPRPSNKYSIERKDNDGNYEPDNCKWALKSEQSRNQSRNRWITYKGITMVLLDWAKSLGLPFRTLDARIQRGWPLSKALNPNLYSYDVRTGRSE